MQVDMDLREAHWHREELNELFCKHSALLFRNQDLTDPEFYNAVEAFGKPWSRSREDGDRLKHTEPTDGSHPFIEVVSESGLLGDMIVPWHIDLLHISTQEIPNRVLYCTEVEDPDEVGTVFISTRLSMHQDIDFTHYKDTNAAYRVDYPVHYIPNTIVRPLLNWHPYHNEYCFNGDLQFTRFIQGLSSEESKKLIQNTIQEMTNTPDQMYEHKWQVGDVLFYDNYSLMHTRPKNVKAKRRLKRMTWDQKWPNRSM